MDGALTLAQATLDPQRERRIIAISDAAPAQASAATDVLADWQIVGSQQANRAIITFAARPWGDRQQIYARAANYAAEPFQTTLRLYGDEQLIDTRQLRLDADGETELTWTLPGTYALLRAELDGDDAQPADDQSYLAIASPPPVKVLLVSTKPDALRRALTAARAQVAVVDPSRYAETVAAAPPIDLTVFDGFLPPTWPAGAVLAINPLPGSALVDVGAFPESMPEGELVQRGAIFEGLSLGGINFGVVQPLQPPAWASTQLAIGDQPLMLAWQRWRARDRDLGVRPGQRKSTLAPGLPAAGGAHRARPDARAAAGRYPGRCGITAAPLIRALPSYRLLGRMVRRRDRLRLGTWLADPAGLLSDRGAGL